MTIPQINIGDIVSSALSILGENLPKWAIAIGEISTKILPHIEKVSIIAQAVASLIGILKPDSKVENIGIAMQEAEKKPADFNSTKEYIEYLENEISSGRINLNTTRTDSQKIVNLAIGATLVIKGIDEKYNLQTSPEFWNTIGMKSSEGKINASEVGCMLENAKKNNVDQSDIAMYLNRSEITSGTQIADISKTIDSGFKEANPNLSDSDISARFNELLKQN